MVLLQLFTLPRQAVKSLKISRHSYRFSHSASLNFNFLKTQEKCEEVFISERIIIVKLDLSIDISPMSQCSISLPPSTTATSSPRATEHVKCGWGREHYI